MQLALFAFIAYIAKEENLQFKKILLKIDIMSKFLSSKPTDLPKISLQIPVLQRAKKLFWEENFEKYWKFKKNFFFPIVSILISNGVLVKHCAFI